MAINNSLVQKKKVPFSVQISSPGFQNLINNTLRDRETANKFVTSIISAVSTNPALQECEAKTIVSAALLGESLKLSPSPQLGQYYLVPFKDKKNGVTNAQFILGYKGYIQLAIRSGQYKKLNVLAIKAGELISYDPLNEEIKIKLIEDDEERENTETTGYCAMFEYLNGFKKVMYWSKEKMLAYADKYSPAFSLHGTAGRYSKVSYSDYLAGKYDQKDDWLYSSFWYKDFDNMACKTMLRQIISKWGVMSIDLQRAFVADGNVIRDEIEDEETTEDVITVENSTDTAQEFKEILEGNENE